MDYILFIILAGYANNDSISSQKLEFSNLEACEQAEKEVGESIYVKETFCLPKMGKY